MIGEPGAKGFFLCGTALTLENIARNATAGIGLLAIIDGQGQKSAIFGRVGATGRHHDNGLSELQPHGSIGLLSNPTRFYGQRLSP